MVNRTLWTKTTIVAAMVCTASGVSARAVDNAVRNAFRARMDGKLDDAKKILESEVANAPLNAAAWLELARLEFQRAGKTTEMDAAQKAIEAAINVAPENAHFHRWAARIAIYNGILKRKNKTEMMEQFKKVATAGEKAVSLNPDDHEARLLLVSLYGNNPPELGGDSELAEKHVKILELRSPVDGAIGRCELSFKNQPEKQLDLWNDLAKSHGKNPLVHEQLALHYARAGNIEKATVHAEGALALDPSRSRILMGLARAFALQKKTEPADKFARAYLDFAPAPPLALRAWTYMALGRIQAMQGNKMASEESLKKATELDPYCWFTMTPPPEQLFDAP